MQWHADGGADGGFLSWVRATRADRPSDEWACIAADLLGPAVADAVGGPFAVATATLAVAVFGSAPPTAWIRQHVSGSLSGGVASGAIELRAVDGALIARGSQRAAVLPATQDELPRSVTAFADSCTSSTLFGMN